MQRFALAQAQFLEDTSAARIWKVTRTDGECAVLKLYLRGHMGNEATGADYLRRAQPLCAQVYDYCEDALVVEWLAGPSLGGEARDGGDKGCRAGDEILAEVAAELVAQAVPPNGMRPLGAQFAPLLDAEGLHNPDLQAAQQLAGRLLASPSVACGLHGDLHPDNVRSHKGRWRVFDAKGLRGPCAYELANAFRHPRGCESYVLAPDTITRRLRLWSEALGCSPQTLAAWATAKTALSLVWSGSEIGQDMALLQALRTRL